MPSHALFRLGRAAVFATVCTVLALAGHTAASGDAVASWMVGGGCAAMTVLAMVLAGHERSLPTIMGGLFGGQFLLHVLFSAGQVAAAHPGVTAAHPGHGGSLVPAVHGTAGMTSAHYVAAMVAAWWLRRGERAVWRLARDITALVLSPVRALLTFTPAVPGRPVRVPALAAVAVRLVGRMLRHVLPRRGPPLRSTVPSLG